MARGGAGRHATSHGSRALILGHGAIGRAIERALAGFGVEVVAVVEPSPAQLAQPDRRLRLDRARGARHARDRGIIGAAELAGMKPEAVLVNFARADCVDQEALVEALAGKRIAAAILDLTDPEPCRRATRCGRSTTRT